MDSFYEEQLKFMTEEKMADWLLKTLTDLYCPDESGKKCDLYFFMTLRGLETPSEALSEIYHRYVKNEDQEMFRKAIGRALHKCAKNYEMEPSQMAEIIDALIYLISWTDAIEALDGLSAVLFKEWTLDDYNKYLYDCLAIMQTLEPCDEVFQFTSALVNNPKFDDGYLLGSIRIMIDCQPDNALSIIDNFGTRLSALYKRVKQEDEAEATEYWHVVNDLFAAEEKIKNKIIFYSKKLAE